MSDPGNGHRGDQRPTRSLTDPRLLEILVCPLSKTVLRYNAGSQELISKAAKLAFPIKDGIPILIPEEARKLDNNDGY
jgi:uncharacterized protein YbaR (Trm112 family)